MFGMSLVTNLNVTKCNLVHLYVIFAGSYLMYKVLEEDHMAIEY